MKYRLICILFGHSFLIGYAPHGQVIGTQPSDWCSKCGLTKEECGIK